MKIHFWFSENFFLILILAAKKCVENILEKFELIKRYAQERVDELKQEPPQQNCLTLKHKDMKISEYDDLCKFIFQFNMKKCVQEVSMNIHFKI